MGPSVFIDPERMTRAQAPFSCPNLVARALKLVICLGTEAKPLSLSRTQLPHRQDGSLTTVLHGYHLMAVSAPGTGPGPKPVVLGSEAGCR